MSKPEKSKLSKEWQEIMKQKIYQIPQNVDDDEIQIVVDKPLPIVKPKNKEDIMSFYLNRIRYKKQENTINLDMEAEPPNQKGKEKSASAARASTPIVSHLKQREQKQKTIINVEEQSSKKNVEKYKESLFGKSQERFTRNKNPVPPPVTLQQSSSDRQKLMKKQMQLIQSANVPRWMTQKNARNQRNRQKYPNSNTFEYNYEINGNKKSSLPQFDEYKWQMFQRQQKLMSEKLKQKQEKEKKQKRVQSAQQQKKRQLKKQQDYESLFSGLMGLPTKKIKKDQPQDQKDTEPISQQNQLRKSQIIEQINAETDEIANDQYSHFLVNKRHKRFGLKQIAKQIVSKAPTFIKMILSHDYSGQIQKQQSKKIPDIFHDIVIYIKAFHYILGNQCIADISQRLKQISKKKSPDALRVTITNSRRNHDGQIQIFLKELGEDTKILKQISLSRYRFGLITSEQNFVKQNYGVPSKLVKKTFGFLVMLITPETKQQFGGQVRCLSEISQSQLQWILRIRKSRNAYFYDLQKLSTNIREYLAVTNIRQYDLVSTILDPRQLEREVCTFVDNKQILDDILNYLQKIFNPTQLESIREMVLKQRGFVLLQGPPGTGKTSTLMGLLSAQYQYIKKIGDPRKIMICAPSNAAVDHIVKRIKCEGLFNGEGDIIHPQVLRVGICQNLDPDIQSVSLDNLCEKQNIATKQKAEKEKKMTSVQIKSEIIKLTAQLRTLSHDKQDQKNQKKAELMRYQERLFSFRTDKLIFSKKNFHDIELKYLKRAQIICTTLSSSGNQKFDCLRGGQIACLIVDEAAQATQPNLLIALQTNVEKVILIGDPYQLPATCKSNDANITLLNRSLFQRFLDAKIHPYFLNIQYRMAPLIRSFPSKRFYHDRLVDSQTVVQRILPQFLKSFQNRNVLFLDVKYTRQQKIGDSYCNNEEAKVVGLLVRCLLQKTISMGVITPYKEQSKRIMNDCRSELRYNQDEKEHIQKNVMINTVDSFQGQQKDIIIVSTVRANSNGHLGFIIDQRRINVTLTRSKYLLIVVGHGDTLGSNQVWNQFLNQRQQSNSYYQLNKPTQQDRSSTINQLFQKPNQSRIKRKRYNHFTVDYRKLRRNQIQSKDFNINRSQDKSVHSSKEQDQIDIPNQIQIIKESSLKEKSIMKIQEKNKYSLDIKESEKILQEKKKKYQEAEGFATMHRRMCELQQKNAKNGGDQFDIFK